MFRRAAFNAKTVDREVPYLEFEGLKLKLNRVAAALCLYRFT